jgi:glycosyltransferase involved in cell wall biosynthesis
MMCGTPVVATRVGAASEVIEDGVTGYLADHVSEMPALTRRAFGLDRERVRATALARFSGARMAESYLAAYEALLTERGASLKRASAR